MKATLLFALVFAPVVGLAGDGQVVRRIDKQRELHIDTPLVEGGKAIAFIAAPATDGKLANQVIARVKQLTGVALPLLDDRKVTDDYLRRFHVIVIGNSSSNKVAEHLYVRNWTFEDYVYPGIAGDEPDQDGPAVTGYVVRTIHDPFGFGHNFVVLAGSEPAGTGEAVKQFTASLDGSKSSLLVPHTVKVRIGTKQLMKPAYGKRELPQAQVNKNIEQMRRTVSRMKSLQDNFWYSTESYAMGYQLTGLECWAKIYKAQMEILAENLERFNALPNNYIEGMHKIVPAWDRMEETPFFTDAERLKLTNSVLEVGCRNEAAWRHYLKDPRREAIDSHGGERVQSLRLAGLYFGNRYGINQHWVTMSDEAIRFMNETPRSCDGYRLGCGHCVRLNLYARRSGDMAYFENGTCRQQADLVMMCTDNQGFAVAVGDHDHLDTRIDRDWGIARYLGEAAWFYKDSSYLWFTQHLAYHELPFEGFTTGQKPALPQRLVGLNVLPVHENVYGVVHDDQHTTVRTFEPVPPLSVTREQAFDKLTFREAVDPRRQYLLLDGVSGMDHGHIDGNGIARYSDLERTWLFDVGWTRVYPRDHNMLLVVKDGESHGPQPFTRLDLASDLDTAAFTRTTIPDYNGMDWSRHLVWLKGVGVLALDRAQAKAEGNYTLRCRWRSAGEAALQPGGLLVTQSGPSFRILNADGSRQRLRQAWLDDTTGGFRTYPHGNKRGETIVYDNVVEKRFAKGESYTFQNLLFASSSEAKRDYRVERVDDSTVRIVSPARVMVAGIWKDSSFFMVSGSRFWLAQGTSLGPLLQASQPVDIEYDFATGKGTVSAKAPAQLRLPGGPPNGLRVPAGKHPLSLLPSPEAAAQVSSLVARYTPAPARTPATNPARPLPGLTTVWETHPAEPAEILDMATGDLDGDGKPEIVTAGDDGAITVLGLDGKVSWRRDGLGRATSVAIARFGGKAQVIAGGHDSPYLFVFDSGGTRVEGAWASLGAAKDSFQGVAAQVRFVAAADMNGDGSDEVLAATRCAQEEAMRGHLYCYDSSGRMIWQRRPVEHELCSGCIDSLKPGGPNVFFAGGSFGNCSGVDGSGGEVFKTLTSHRSTVLCPADVDGDGTNEILIGGQDNCIHLHSHDGKRRWMHNVGGAASGIAVADLNGDHQLEILVTTAELSSNVFSLAPDGKRLWQAQAGEEVNALLLANVDNRPGDEIILGTDGAGVIVLDGQGKPMASAPTIAPVAELAVCPGATSSCSDIIAALKNGAVARLSKLR